MTRLDWIIWWVFHVVPLLGLTIFGYLCLLSYLSIMDWVAGRPRPILTAVVHLNGLLAEVLAGIWRGLGGTALLKE